MRIRELLCEMGWSERSELSLFEVGDGRVGRGGMFMCLSCSNRMEGLGFFSGGG